MTDFTDPTEVIGAVLAQIEDLDYVQQVQVLAEVLAQITELA
jgi:hypothetical protein